MRIGRIARRQKLVFAAILSLSLVAAAVLSPRLISVYQNRDPGWSKYRPLSPSPTEEDRRTREQFVSGEGTDEDRYRLLFYYFVRGFLSNAGQGMSAVNYPGLPSTRGYAVDGLKGFARTAPLIGAWISSGRTNWVFDPKTKLRVDLVELLRQGVLNGTDPTADGYWGRMIDGDPRIVEAADIARLLWLTREQIWFRLSRAEKDQVIKWLSQVNEVKTERNNNWLLFAVTVNAFLKNVGEPHTDRRDNYLIFKDNYLGNGWFRDGPRGKVDYYNTWGISYELFWISRLDPSLDHTFIKDVLVKSARLTSHLISPIGIPIIGRSICYRTAVPSVILAGSVVSPFDVQPGLARRALDVTWRHFVSRDILRQGTITMGYYETDPRFVDWYTGAGSCHWALRSLTLAYMLETEHPFWTDAPKPLPVELGDFNIVLPRLSWTIVGRHSDQNITVLVGTNSAREAHPQAYSRWDKLLEGLTHRPRRPGNYRVKYGLKEYSAASPMGGVFNRRRATAERR